MKKFFYPLFFLLISFWVKPVFAGNDITITCNSGASECTVSPNLPIFNEANIYPGYTAFQNFFVDNNRNGACNLTLKATSNSESLLSSKIFIDVIGTNNSNDLNISHYLLNDLLDSSKPKLSLGHVNKNKQNSYKWTITLDKSADNNFQNLISNFNVDFNFECDDETNDNPGDVLGTSVSVTSSNNPSSPQCANSVPIAPTGFYVVDNNGSATLHWNQTLSDHTGYLIAFGTSPGNYQYGAPNIGNDDHYTVKSLTPGAQYCFYVRSLNGCMPGERTPEYCLNPGSNIVAANIAPEGFQPGVLGVTTDNETSSTTPTPENNSTGKILGESNSICTKQFLPLIFLIALFLNILFIRRFSTNWIILLLVSFISFIIDYLLSKNSCCFGQKWLCSYYWVGNLLSFLIPSILSNKQNK